MAFMNSVGNMASIWTPYTYPDSSAPHYREALGVVLGLLTVAFLSGLALRLYLQKQNNRFARLENADTELRPSDLRKLEKTAEVEGIDLAAARQLQKGFRYAL